MKRYWIVLIVVFAFAPRSVAAQSSWREAVASDGAYAFGTALSIGTIFADYYTTTKCVHDFPVQCREANIVLVPLVKQHGIDKVMVGTVVARLGVVVGVALVRWKKPDWRSFTSESMLTMGGVQVAVVTSNAITLHRLQQGRP